MVRISDIFKKSSSSRPPAANVAKPEKESVEKKPLDEPKPRIVASVPEVAAPSIVNYVPAQRKETEAENANQMHIAKAMQETVSDRARSHNLYLMGIQLVKEALFAVNELKPVNLVQLEHWISDIVDALIFSDSEFLRLFYDHTSENFLNNHMVNVSIITVEIGMGLGYNKSQLNELALAGFLHDIGMIKVEELGMQVRKLSEEEYGRIKNHPIYGVEILSKIKGITDPVIYVAKEEHERIDGTGYPAGLKNGEISEYARIVMIADVYEALTHNRPYRKKISPHEAIKELIANNLIFDSAILKVLINKIGVYPVGSWAELNSNEICKVMINNNDFPLRPVVHVLFDAAGHKLKDQRIINLAKQFNLFIKKSLTDEELAREIKGTIDS